MIDGHCHLRSGHAHVAEAMCELHDAALLARVKGIVLLNLEESGYSNRDVIAEARKYGNYFDVFPSVVPAQKAAMAELASLKDDGASGLKLHPRMHGYRVDDDACVLLVREAGKLNMPVMIDAFPDGRSVLLGNTVEAFARLADRAPEARIAIGHAAGHNVLDALMLAKSFTNVYLDLSYTLLYYRTSSIPQDIAYSITSMKGDRIFWGTDYPDRPYELSVGMCLDELGKMDLPSNIRQSVLESNVKGFLGK